MWSKSRRRSAQLAQAMCGAAAGFGAAVAVAAHAMMATTSFFGLHRTENAFNLAWSTIPANAWQSKCG